MESRITIQNRGFLPKMNLEVRDFTSLPGHVTGTVLTLGPYGSAQWQPRVPVRKRGVYPMGPVTAYSRDPFGVFQLTKTLPEDGELVVVPTAEDLPHFFTPRAEFTARDTARLRGMRRTPHAASVREYYPGDRLTHIHWPATAHHGRLMVKEFDTDIGGRIWIVLDLQRAVQAGDDSVDNTEELGVTVAASIMKKYLAEGWPVGFIAYGEDRYFVPADTGAGRFPLLLDMLARVKAYGELPLEAVLAQEARTLESLSSVVVISPSLRWSPTALEPLLKKRAGVTVVLVDPASFGGAEDPTPMLSQLQLRGIPAYPVRRGDNLATALDHRVTLGGG